MYFLEIELDSRQWMALENATRDNMRTPSQYLALALDEKLDEDKHECSVTCDRKECLNEAQCCDDCAATEQQEANDALQKELDEANHEINALKKEIVALKSIRNARKASK